MNKFDSAKPLFRALTFSGPLIDVEKRTVSFPFSSELPVERYFGREILDHSQGSCDMSRVNNAAALLLDHDRSKQIGVVEKCWLEEAERRLWVTVRFSKNEDAEKIFQDVIDKIRRNVSFGYMIDEKNLKAESESTPDNPVYRAMKWMPYEVSIVSVPADATVGVGRSADVNAEGKNNPPQADITIKDNENKENKRSPKMDEELKRKESEKKEAEIKEITAIANTYGLEKEALTAISSGKSLSDFQKECIEILNKRTADVPSAAKVSGQLGLDKKEVKQYSILRIIRALSNPTDAKAQDAAKFEREISDQCVKSFGVSPQGIFIPYDILAAKREFNSTTGAGSNLIATNLLAGSFIEKLDNAMVVRKLGARVMMGLVGNITIPKQTGRSTAYWIAKNGDITAGSNPTIGQVPLTPKTVGAYTDIGRDLLKQSSRDAEALVQDDLATALALGIDLASLKGTGEDNQPTGIYNTSGVATVTIVGGTPTWGNIVEFETDVDIANALDGNLAYVMNSAMRGTLKTAPKVSGYPIFIMGEDGRLNGYKSAVTNQLSSGEMIFGNFGDVIIGMWGGLDMTVDPYTNGKSGALRVIVLQDVDIALRRAESFSTAIAGS